MLPASVVYDVLLSPFVLYAVIRARALAARSRPRRAWPRCPGGSASQAAGGARPGGRGRPCSPARRRGGPRQRDRGRAPRLKRPAAAGRAIPGRLGQRRPRPRPGAGRRGRCTCSSAAAGALSRAGRPAGRRIGAQAARPGR